MGVPSTNGSVNDQANPFHQPSSPAESSKAGAKSDSTTTPTVSERENKDKKFMQRDAAARQLRASKAREVRKEKEKKVAKKHIFSDYKDARAKRLAFYKQGAPHQPSPEDRAAAERAKLPGWELVKAGSMLPDECDVQFIKGPFGPSKRLLLRVDEWKGEYAPSHILTIVALGGYAVTPQMVQEAYEAINNKCVSHQTVLEQGLTAAPVKLAQRAADSPDRSLPTRAKNVRTAKRSPKN
jgi:hypothetical protein